jgi:hypothetical protein
LGKQFSKWILIRSLQLHLFTWQRVLKSLTAEGIFQFFKHELALLGQDQQLRKIRHWYYDESGQFAAAIQSQPNCHLRLVSYQTNP